jgi:hypothetical protein
MAPVTAGFERPRSFCPVATVTIRRAGWATTCASALGGESLLLGCALESAVVRPRWILVCARESLEEEEVDGEL